MTGSACKNFATGCRRLWLKLFLVLLLVWAERRWLLAQAVEWALGTVLVTALLRAVSTVLARLQGN